MNTIPTAEEFLIDWTGVDNSTHPNEELRNNFIQSKNQMIEFAKLHVEAALKEASERNGKYFILNAYPLTNIK